MPEPEIKAKLVLVSEDSSGVSGGGNGSVFTASEERLFRQEQSEANKATSRFLPLMALQSAAGIAGIGTGLAGAIAGLLGGVSVIPGDTPKGAKPIDGEEQLIDLGEVAEETAESMQEAGEQNVEDWHNVSNTLIDMSNVIGTESTSAATNLKLMSAVIDATPDSFLAMMGAMTDFINQLKGHTNELVQLRRSMGSFVRDPLNSSKVIDFYEETSSFVKKYRAQQGTVNATEELNQSGRNPFNTTPYDLVNKNYNNRN